MEIVFKLDSARLIDLYIGVALDFDIFALFRGHEKSAEDGDHKKYGHAEAALKAELSAVEHPAEISGRAFEDRVEFGVSADAESKYISLSEIPDRVYSSYGPDAAALEHEDRGEYSEEEDVYKCDNVEIRISAVEERKHQRADDYSYPDLGASGEGGHKIPTEERFLAHALQYEAEEKYDHHYGVEVIGKRYRDAAAEVARYYGRQYHNKAY